MLSKVFTAFNSHNSRYIIRAWGLIRGFTVSNSNVESQTSNSKEILLKAKKVMIKQSNGEADRKIQSSHKIGKVV